MKKTTLLCSGYSAEEGNDLLLVELDENGKAAVRQGYRQGDNPSFCIQHGSFLYTVSELTGQAAITAYLLKDGQLVETGKKMNVPGGELCHLYAGERALYGSSYGTGDFFAVDYALEQVLWHRSPQMDEEKEKEIEISQTVEQNASRQETPHAHWATEWNGQLFLADLGRDRIYRYRLQDGLPAEELPALQLVKGAGPRQVLPVGDDRYLLSVQELDGTLCLWDMTGAECEDYREEIRSGKPVQKNPQTYAPACVQTLCTTAGNVENYPGAICMADDQTVLVCNRGSNTIAAIRLQESGKLGKRLQLLGEWKTGNWPRHLLQVQGTGFFVNGCNKEGKLYVFSWENSALVKTDEIVLHGASCAAQLTAE